MVKSEDVKAKKDKARHQIHEKANLLLEYARLIYDECIVIPRQLIRNPKWADQEKLKEAFTEELWEALDDTRNADDFFRKAKILVAEIDDLLEELKE